MNLSELIEKRYSCRNYANKPVDRALVEKICKEAVKAPSACNSQPWKMYAINGERAKALTPLIQIYNSNKWADNVSAYIVIEQTAPNAREKFGERLLKSNFVANDIGILTAHIVLAAESLGVQSCILGMRDEKKIAEFLSLPKKSKFPLIIALGYADKDDAVRPKARKSFKDVFIEVK